MRDNCSCCSIIPIGLSIGIIAGIWTCYVVHVVPLIVAIITTSVTIIGFILYVIILICMAHYMADDCNCCDSCSWSANYLLIVWIILTIILTILGIVSLWICFGYDILTYPVAIGLTFIIIFSCLMFDAIVASIVQCCCNTSDFETTYLGIYAVSRIA